MDVGLMAMRKRRDGTVALCLDDREVPDNEIITITAGRLASWGYGILKAIEEQPRISRTVITDKAGEVVNVLERSIVPSR